MAKYEERLNLEVFERLGSQTARDDPGCIEHEGDMLWDDLIGQAMRGSREPDRPNNLPIGAKYWRP